MNAAHLHVVDPELERLWDAYVAARHVVDQTNDFADAVAAGMAWKAFMERFCPDESGAKHG